MMFYDFEYDGMLLSDFGYIVCTFGDSGSDTISNGSEITFNTVPVRHGDKQERISTEYKSTIETTICICKNVCDPNTDFSMSVQEIREMMRWLNRKEYLPFRIMTDDMIDVWFSASFNVNRVEINGETAGLELHMQTNRPYATNGVKTTVLKFLEANGEKSVVNLSDDHGALYPKAKIECHASGNLSLYNALDDRVTYIANVSDGEVITMDDPVITTSLSSHAIQDDFNWNFLRLVSSYRENINKITASLPCTVTLVYEPIVKIGI